MKTGFKALDKLINIDNKLIIIGGRLRTERTKLYLNIATNIALRQNIPTLIFSESESKEKIINRILASENRIDMTDIKENTLTKDEKEKIQNTRDILNKAPLYIEETKEIDFEEFKRIVKKLKKEKDIQFIVVDYFKLNNGIDYFKVGKELKRIQKELNVTIMAIVKISIEVLKTKDKKPLVKYFKESRPLVDLADIVMLIYRDDYYNDDSEDKDILELTIVRNADGERGKIQLVALDKYCKFVDMIKKS